MFLKRNFYYLKKLIMPDKDLEKLSIKKKRPTKNTYEYHMQKCQSMICSQKASMVFFKSSCFCELLNPPEPNFDLDSLTNYNKLSGKVKLSGNIVSGMVKVNPTCNDSGSDIVWKLSGFFIKPTLADLNIDSNKFSFEPIWINDSGANYIEVTTTPIVVEPTGLFESDNHLNYYVVPQQLADGYNHNWFQFNIDAIDKDFERAYISFYALKSIIEYSESIGISGSMIVTDNFNIGDIYDKNRPKSSCSESYFTYRFTGFKPHSKDVPLPEFTDIELRRIASGSEILIKANVIEKSGQFETIHTIPAETWATPCPPMWV